MMADFVGRRSRRRGFQGRISWGRVHCGPPLLRRLRGLMSKEEAHSGMTQSGPWKERSR